MPVATSLIASPARHCSLLSNMEGISPSAAEFCDETEKNCVVRLTYVTTMC